MASVSNKKKNVNKGKNTSKKKMVNLVQIKMVSLIQDEEKAAKTNGIGHFGKTITFRVSDEKLLTFQNMNRTVTGRWATHSTIGKKEKTEFVGPGLDKISMTLFLSYAHGVKPRNVIKRLEKVVKNGTAKNLVIGGKKIGKNKYRITSMSEAWNEIYNNGFLYQANVDVTFEEYVE